MSSECGRSPRCAPENCLSSGHKVTDFGLRPKLRWTGARNSAMFDRKSRTLSAFDYPAHFLPGFGRDPATLVVFVREPELNTLLLTHPSGLDHDNGPGHPERPDRVRVIERILEHEKFMTLIRGAGRQGTREQALARSSRILRPGARADLAARRLRPARQRHHHEPRHAGRRPFAPSAAPARPWTK